MGSTRILAIALLAAGVLALVYGGFTYTKDTDKASLGPVQLVVQNKEHVNIPVWAGVAAIVAGGALLLTAGKKT
ncbi:MAG TPA: hypothetical protein VHE78_04280 [Gemmatimonadaceae bacterium]|nr:hypothetical protein [Gemmatimonadaceae bacterium]